MDGWTFTAYCPHGMAFRLPLRVMGALDIRLIGCKVCQSEREVKPMTRRERRWFRRHFGDMKGE